MWERYTPGKHGFGDVVFEDWEVQVLKQRAKQIGFPLIGENEEHNTFLGHYSPQAGVLMEEDGMVLVRAKVGWIEEIERVLGVYFNFTVTKRV